MLSRRPVTSVLRGPLAVGALLTSLTVASLVPHVSGPFGGAAAQAQTSSAGFTSSTSTGRTTTPSGSSTSSTSSTFSTTRGSSSDTTTPQTVPDGKGRTGPQLGETGTTLPRASFGVRLTLAATVENPLAVVQRPKDDTVYVLEKPGRVRAIRKGVLDLTPLLDITKKTSTQNEQGLLGLAFHPTDEKRLFLDYTDLKGNVTVSEFSFDGTTIDPSSERVLLKIAKPFKEHNGGTILFDRTGALLIGIGDGGGSGDPLNNAQRTDSLLGKMLRIIPDPKDGKPYSIPTDNPFAVDKRPPGSNQPLPRAEIYAYGLRNPWRISIDRSNGDVWVPDVGQAKQEEINRMPSGTSGQNFGWRNREGTKPYKGARPPKSTDPVYDYSHTDGHCAVVGGFVYRGKAIPSLVGWYVFGDVCTGQIMALKPGKKWMPFSLGAKLSYLTAFGEGNDGELWATSYEGTVARIVAK